MSCGASTGAGGACAHDRRRGRGRAASQHHHHQQGEAQHTTDDPFAKYGDYEELLRSSSRAPSRPQGLVLELYESGGRIKRRQDMPAEAFWTAAELRAIVEAARKTLEMIGRRGAA